MMSVLGVLACGILLCSSQAGAASFPFQISNVPPESLSTDSSGLNLEILEYRASAPPSLVFPDDFKGRDCKVDGKVCRAGFKLVLKPKMSADKVERQLYDISFSEHGSKKHYEVSLLPKSFQGYTHSGRSQIETPVTVSTTGGIFKGNRCNLFSIAADATLLFFKKIDHPCIDFRPHRVRGKIYYSFELMGSAEDKGGWLGPRVVLDQDFGFKRQIDGNFDMHEFLLLDDDHTYSIEIELGRLKTGMLYSDRRVRERKNGKIVFDWGVSELLSQFDAPTVGSYFVRSGEEAVAAVYHINSIQVLDENTLLIGLRDAGVVCVDKRTKKVIWAFGGFIDQFGLTLKQQPISVHSAQFDLKTNRLLVFANRSTASPVAESPSRVLEYQLDLKNKKVMSLEIPRPGPEVSVFMGSVQQNGAGLYSITYGQRIKTSQDNFIEIKDGKAVFSIGFIEPQTLIYRAYREPFGEPRESAQ